MSPKPKPPAKPAAVEEEDEADQYDPAEHDAVEDEEEEEPVRNKAKKKLSSEAAAHRVRANAAEARLAQAEARIAELEQSAGTEEMVAENLELRVANAFLHEMAGRDVDLDAAFKLIDRTLIEVTDGEVTGMDNAVHNVLARYPHLLNDSKQAKTQPDSLSGPSGRSFNGKKGNNQGLDMQALAKRFPSLRGRIGK